MAGLQRCRLPPPQPGAGGGERKREKGKRHCSHWAAARGISSSCRGPRGRLGPAAPSPPLPGCCFSHPPLLWGCRAGAGGVGTPQTRAALHIAGEPPKSADPTYAHADIYAHTYAYMHIFKQTGLFCRLQARSPAAAGGRGAGRLRAAEAGADTSGAGGLEWGWRMRRRTGQTRASGPCGRAGVVLGLPSPVTCPSGGISAQGCGMHV